MDKAYNDAARPFISEVVTEAITNLKSWRYFLELNSGCNLRCPSCTKGNQESVNGLKYEHQTGFMDLDLMERILDKIRSENPNAIVFLYGNSEPFLSPHVPECIAAIKRRGLHPEMSTNLNHIQRVDETLAAGPELVIVSLSGFTQEVYEKGHAGGKIDKVKANMQAIGEANRRQRKPVRILVNYHVYRDNGHEVEPMRAYALSCGLEFFTSYARAISMENTIQYCRSRDAAASEFEVQPGRPDWNAILPPVSENYIQTMDRLHHNPIDARAMYSGIPMSTVCPVGAGGLFTFIRHDGKTSMCACVADRRITVGDYLDTTPSQMIDQRADHSICKQCLKYRLNLYYHIVDEKKWICPA